MPYLFKEINGRRKEIYFHPIDAKDAVNDGWQYVVAAEAPVVEEPIADIPVVAEELSGIPAIAGSKKKPAPKPKAAPEPEPVAVDEQAPVSE